MFIHYSHSYLLLPIHGNGGSFVHDSDHGFSRLPAYLNQVKTFTPTLKHHRFGFWTVQRDKISELMKEKLTSNERDAYITNLVSGLANIETSVTINHASPEIRIVFKSCDLSAEAFSGHYTKFSEIRNNVRASKLNSKMWFTLYFFFRSIWRSSFNFIVGNKKISELLDVFEIFFRRGKIYSISEYISVSDEHTNPVRAFWSNIRKAIFVYRISTACSYFYFWYSCFSHGKPHLLVGQGRMGADNTMRPALISYGMGV